MKSDKQTTDLLDLGKTPLDAKSDRAKLTKILGLASSASAKDIRKMIRECVMKP